MTSSVVGANVARTGAAAFVLWLIKLMISVYMAWRPAGVLEVLTAVLAALLNMSTLVGNQPKIARRGLTVLLKANSSLFQVVSSRVCCTTLHISIATMQSQHACFMKITLESDQNLYIVTNSDQSLRGPNDFCNWLHFLLMRSAWCCLSCLCRSLRLRLR
jgi:hypothetical protein